MNAAAPTRKHCSSAEFSRAGLEAEKLDLQGRLPPSTCSHILTQQQISCLPVGQPSFPHLPTELSSNYQHPIGQDLFFLALFLFNPLSRQHRPRFHTLRSQTLCPSSLCSLSLSDSTEMEFPGHARPPFRVYRSVASVYYN